MGKVKGHGRKRLPGQRPMPIIDVEYSDLTPEETWPGGPKIAAFFPTVRDVLILASDPVAVGRFINHIVEGIEGVEAQRRMAGSLQGALDIASLGGVVSEPDPENGHIYLGFRAVPHVFVNAPNLDRLTRWFRTVIGYVLAKERRDTAIAQN